MLLKSELSVKDKSKILLHIFGTKNKTSKDIEV